MHESTTAPQKVQVSERALLARINRRLDKERELIRKCRPDARGYATLGDYHRIDWHLNAVIDTHVNLEDLSRDLDLLKPWEVLARE
jgi:hypothetical protein